MVTWFCSFFLGTSEKRCAGKNTQRSGWGYYWQVLFQSRGETTGEALIQDVVKEGNRQTSCFNYSYGDLFAEFKV